MATMTPVVGALGVPEPVRQALQAVGLTSVARRVLLRALPDERTLSIDGTTARFGQTTFGDYVELNQLGAERPVIERLRAEIRPDDVFLDVGGNLGAYAVFIGGRLQEGSVVAVEAVPATAEKLAANLDRNEVDAAVANVAFSDESGTVGLTVPDAHGSAAVTSDPAATTVRAVPGDAYLAEVGLPTPTVLKVDVEGHELPVLRGLEETLATPACRLVYCELHEDHAAAADANSGAAPELLREYGFSVARLADLPGDRHVIRAVKD